MNETPVAEPSYAIAAVGGIFLGVLAATVAFIFNGHTPWVLLVMPVAGLFAGILGTYVAAEPYVELKESYDKLAQAAAHERVSHEQAVQEGGGQVSMDGATVVERVLPPEVADAAERLNGESVRLAREAAEAGEDGLKVAEAAEVLRREAALLRSLKP